METRQKSKKVETSSFLLGRKRSEDEQCKIKQSKHKKSTKQFDFFYNRSCFRNMCGFYKSNY